MRNRKSVTLNGSFDQVWNEIREEVVETIPVTISRSYRPATHQPYRCNVPDQRRNRRIQTPGDTRTLFQHDRLTVPLHTIS